MESAATLANNCRIEADDLAISARPLSQRREPSVPPPVASLDDVQREHIQSVLRAVAGNKTEAARVLGIDRVTLYRRMKRFGSSEPERR
jgi:transcriptional regulator of acetoin/glycerol metabolism